MKNLEKIRLNEILEQKLKFLDDSEIPQSILEDLNKMTYVELRGFLNYLLRFVNNSTTKSVLQDIIKTLTKLEYTSAAITPTITHQRIKQSRPLLRF